MLIHICRRYPSVESADAQLELDPSILLIIELPLLNNNQEMQDIPHPHAPPITGPPPPSSTFASRVPQWCVIPAGVLRSSAHSTYSQAWTTAASPQPLRGVSLRPHRLLGLQFVRTILEEAMNVNFSCTSACQIDVVASLPT